MRKIFSLAIMIVAYATAQTPSPQFEVASIKPSPPPTGGRTPMRMLGGPGTKDPGLFRCENCILYLIIQRAFGVQNYQLSVPDWTQSSRFDVSAKIPAETTKEQFQVMLQNLLAERFKMTFHREKKQMQAYDLAVAKNGPKFKPSVEVPAAAGDQPQPPGPVKRKGFLEGFSDNRTTLQAAEGTMPELAEELGFKLQSPITDATGLSGKFQLTLTWSENDSPDSPGPTLFQALQAQLGLKLEPKKALVDPVVIDHIEKTSTEN